jgi:Domain of unknown function (DUF4251)
MKKIIMMMSVMVLVMGTLTAQKLTKAEKKAAKQEKKAAKKQAKKEEKANYELYKAEGKKMIESKDFVLIAQMISGKDKRPIPVVDNSNFVKIEGEEIVVQFALNRPGIQGTNDMGGNTYKGTIRKLEANDLGEGKPINVRVDFVSPSIQGVATIYIDIMGSAVKAQMIDSGGVINFSGKYIALKDAFLLQGWSRN